ncbi:MAG: hypothetical protein J6O41_01290 [Clostridia bacterium]|nr:hypothetical protein [Clostridia bacterium]
MINVDINIAKKNIEEVVDSMGFKRTNYVFLRNKLVTQEIMVYNKNVIVTFFVRIIKKNCKLKKYCHKTLDFIYVNIPFYDLIVSRVIMHEYNIANIEYIDYSDDDNKLFFEDNAGKHRFKISVIDIYGFDQIKQINRLKEFVDQTKEKIASRI